MLHGKFVHLHLHSSYSFEDGTAGVEKLVRRCRELGMDALALTDYDGLYGAVRFFRHAREAGIKPILGAEVTLEGGDQLLLLAKEQDGYANLCRLISAMHLSRPEVPPVCSAELLGIHSRGMIALAAGPSGEIGRLLLAREEEAAAEALGRYLEIFGKDRFFLELQDHGLAIELDLNWGLLRLSKRFDVGVVATNNVHFLNPKELRLHRELVGAGKAVHHRAKRPRPNRDYYLKSPAQMAALFREVPEALVNTVAIAEACCVDLGLGNIRPPRVFSTRGEDAEDLLARGCRAALPALFPGRIEAAQKRLRQELEAIKARGLADYFLLVQDIVRFAQSAGIRTSCRGSAPSSIVLHLLGVSQVDPLVHDLLFERFLNVEREQRQDLPDIDLDFDSRRRDEILAYVLDRYGLETSCMVATVPTLEARSALRELARAEGMSYAEIERLMSYLPYLPGAELRQALHILPELRKSPLREGRYAGLVELAEQVSGTPHHLSVHLGGVVVWEHLADLVPMQRSAKGLRVAQFDKDDLESLGLIKTDLLSLRMLGALGEAEEAIRKKDPGFDFRAIPPDDEKVYRLLCSTDTVGCFQLESPGMRQLLGRLQPGRFADIVANVSLFRPGPMLADMVTPYLARRWGREQVVYPHPRLEPILEETYGVIVFQEQIMRICQAIAGFTLGEADLLRRSLAGAGKEELADHRRKFLAGATNNGVRGEAAGKIFETLAAYSGYGFPKAHAAGFARIAYESAYLKVHYPLEFFLGLLRTGPGLYPLSVLANEARRCGVDVLGPDINKSEASFSLSGRAIRTGLDRVRGVGPVSLRMILAEQAKRPFASVDDLRQRVKLQRRQLENLVLCGALDALEPNRRRLLLALRSDLPAGEVADFPAVRKVHFELALTGLAFSGHPLAFIRSELGEQGVATSRKIRGHADGDRVQVAGLKIVLHTPPTRSGQRVVFLTLEDEAGLTDITIFPAVQERDAEALFGRGVLLVEGTVQRMYPRALTILADKVTALVLAS